jgi:hypothetical protein
LMWGFQKPIPWAKPGEKWVLMDRIFKSGLWTDLAGVIDNENQGRGGGI